MFRKLVSNLPFSPALVGQLGFYARRLKKEQVTRRLGLIFTALAIVAQSFAVFNPPDQALASSASDIVPGGVSSVSAILSLYDSGSQGRNDFKALMDYFGVTRQELAAMKLEKTCSKDRSIISFGRQHLFSSSEGELKHQVPSPQGVSNFYSTPLYLHDRFNGGSFCTESFVGNSSKVGWFSIMKKCGNFQIKQNVRRLPKASFISASCKSVQGFAYDERQLSQPVRVHLFFGGPPGKGKAFGPILANQASPASPAGDGHGFSFNVPKEYQVDKPTQVWGVMQPLPGWPEATVQLTNIATVPGGCTPQTQPPTPVTPASCDDCGSEIAQSKEAKNMTRGSKDADNTTVESADRIEYMLYTTNVGSKTTKITIEENLADVLEYATMFENGGGTMDNNTKLLSWGDVELKPGQTDVRRFIVQISEQISTTPRAGNNPSSYNCVLTNSYGNTTNIKVACPVSKTIETSVQQLPATGSSENILFGGVLLMIVTYFYARSRQMNKEVRILKKEFDGGTL